MPIIIHGPCETTGCDRPAQVSRGLENFLCTVCAQKEMREQEAERQAEWKKTKEKWLDGGIKVPSPDRASIQFSSFLPDDSPLEITIPATETPEIPWWRTSTASASTSEEPQEVPIPPPSQLLPEAEDG